jgi:hypothetical protein
VVVLPTPPLAIAIASLRIDNSPYLLFFNSSIRILSNSSISVKL